MFRDRADAGRQLALGVARLRLRRPVVVGLPRGGVPVAAVVARRLHAPLDVLVVRKLGCPWQPELGFGALGEDGVRVLNQALIDQIGLARADMDAVARREQAELDQRVRRYRAGRPAVALRGRTVVVVDDGIATGSSARAALDVARQRGAARLVLAVPVAPRDVVRDLRRVADDVVCLSAPLDFGAVGQHYEDFLQVSDAEVAALLTGAADAGDATAASG